MKLLSYIRRTTTVLLSLLVLCGEAYAQQEHPIPMRSATIKLETDLVMLNTVVTDQAGKSVPALKKGDFKVYEDGVEQSVTFFRSEVSPVSWGIVLDRSGSMMNMIGDVSRAAVHVIDQGTDKDEEFVATFNEDVQLLTDFETDKRRLENSVKGLQASGRTALWDAVAFGLEQMNRGKYRKKILVVITDGEDNSSHILFEELLNRAEKSEILIYTVGMFEPEGLLSGLFGESEARKELRELAEATGGRAHFPTSVKQCKEAMAQIAVDVSQQYVLGYYPTNPARDGKWRKIQAVAGQGQDTAGYKVRTRAGYFAPKEGGVE